MSLGSGDREKRFGYVDSHHSGRQNSHKQTLERTQWPSLGDTDWGEQTGRKSQRLNAESLSKLYNVGSYGH